MRIDSIIKNFNGFHILQGWRSVLYATALAWGAALAYSTATARVLYGDGAWFLLIHLLTPHHFNDYDFQRTFASMISQAPILLGQRLGFDSVASYAALYSFGIFALPAVTMFIALVLARRQPVLFAMIGFAILVYGFGANFINTEANLFFGFVWLSVTILALQGPAPILRGLVLPAIAIALLRSYEGMLLVGPFLALWAAIAAFRQEGRLESIGLVLAALLYFLGTCIGMGGFLSPRDPLNASNFLSTAFAYLGHPHMFLLLAGIVIIPGICRPSRRLMCILTALSALLGLSFVLGILKLEGFYSFSLYYENRSFMVLFLPVFLGLALAVYAYRPAWLLPNADSTGYTLFLVPLAFAATGDAVGTYRWSSYVQSFCTVLEMPDTPLERLVALKNSGASSAWGWTHPTMSVLLRDRGNQSIVINEPGASAWEPFDPMRAISIPYLGLCQAPLVGRAKPDSFDLPIDFISGSYPSFIVSVSGLSNPEEWATWSEGPKVEFRFARPLPRSFDIKLRIGSAFGSNKALPVKVRAGGRELSFVAGQEPTEITLEFRETNLTTTLTFDIPRPESPAEMWGGADTRKLGIAFVSLAVDPK